PQPESPSHTTPKPNRGKGTARDTNESPPKLVKASTKVRADLDTPALIPFEINGKLYHLTNKEILAHYELEERKQKAAHEAKLLALSKLELIKIIHKEATKAGVDPKALSSKKGGQEFLKIQDAEIKVLNKEHSKKIQKAKELRKKMIDQYRWTTTNRRKSKTIIDIHIHPNTKPVAITVYKGNDKNNFDVHKPFRKRKHRELEPEVRIPGLKCNRSLPEGVPFINNLVIEHPENVIFFIDVFDDEAFKKMSDVHKVDVDTLLTYLVMDSNINTPTNQKFYAILRSLIDSHPDKENPK
ncbi:hypothetical protein Tco_0648605, partial [Tanacetum coccineum]